MWLTADDRDHERKSQHSSPDKGLRCAPNADPDGKRILEWAGIDRLSRERWAMLSRPVDRGIFPDSQQELEFLDEERVVVLNIETEEGIGFGE